MTGPMFIPEGITAPMSWPSTTTPWWESTPVGNRRTMTDWHEHFRLHREMTAADLGLREPVPFFKYMEKANPLYHDMPISDAPYSFWLGADNA